MGAISYVIITSFAVFVAAYILPGVHVDAFTTAVVVAIVLGLVNAFLKPILLFLTLPLTIITLGIFAFILNGLMILLVDYLIPGLRIDNFLWALIFWPFCINYLITFRTSCKKPLALVIEILL